jgi:hypothetical protein
LAAAEGADVLEHSDPLTQIAHLLLPIVAQLSPCTETALVTHLSGATRPGVAFDGPGGATIVSCSLRKLSDLRFLQSKDEHIEVTDVGKLFIKRVPPSLSEPKADVATGIEDAVHNKPEVQARTLRRAQRTEILGRLLRRRNAEDIV